MSDILMKNVFKLNIGLKTNNVSKCECVYTFKTNVKICKQ